MEKHLSAFTAIHRFLESAFNGENSAHCQLNGAHRFTSRERPNMSKEIVKRQMSVFSHRVHTFVIVQYTCNETKQNGYNKDTLRSRRLR